jgi:hypothetical protein
MLGLAGLAATVFGNFAFVHPETDALTEFWLIGLSAIRRSFEGTDAAVKNGVQIVSTPSVFSQQIAT